AIFVGLLTHFIIFRIIHKLADRSSSVLYEAVFRRCRQPSRLLFPLLVIYIALPLLSLPLNILSFINSTFSILFIFSVIWLLIRIILVFEDLLLNRYKLDVSDNLQARRMHTQVQIIRKICIVMVSILGAASVLMSFEKFRELGTGLLASAGIAGIVIGLAAQKTLANLLAGIQIAITQPIRIDDVVIVESEWGRIEEITLTYVVVRIWDLRRLVVPISYFIEKPFQNWTRVSANLLGTVFLYVDYTVPVSEIRDELGRILNETDLWDKKVSGLVVTNCTEKTMELRALMSAADSSAAWNLHCHVREKLIEFVQKKYPDGLPRARAEFNQKPFNDRQKEDRYK
nr:mechanosensitive ion channel [bacterium]